MENSKTIEKKTMKQKASSRGRGINKTDKPLGRLT